MKYRVTIKNDFTRTSYSFYDQNADLCINGNLKFISSNNCIFPLTTLNAKSITLNGSLNCERVAIIANSIFINRGIRAQGKIDINSTDLLDLNAIISSNDNAISLKAKRIIIRKDIQSHYYNNIIDADKILLLGDIKSIPEINFSITDYIIIVGSLPPSIFDFNSSSLTKEIKDKEMIKRALIDDFNIQEPELSKILEKC